MRTKTRISDPHPPLEKQNVMHQTAPDPPPPPFGQENFVSNDGFFGLSLSVLRGGGQAGRMERHFDASERGGEGVQGVGKKSYRNWKKNCLLHVHSPASEPKAVVAGKLEAEQRCLAAAAQLGTAAAHRWRVAQR